MQYYNHWRNAAIQLQWSLNFWIFVCRQKGTNHIKHQLLVFLLAAAVHCDLLCTCSVQLAWYSYGAIVYSKYLCTGCAQYIVNQHPVPLVYIVCFNYKFFEDLLKLHSLVKGSVIDNILPMDVEVIRATWFCSPSEMVDKFIYMFS